MLQILVCSDVHTYTDNIRLAIQKIDRVDAILLAGDQEAELDQVLAACGDIPCYAVSGNNDYYLNTDYPEELLIDISENTQTSLRGPSIVKVTKFGYDSLPEQDAETAPVSDRPLPALSSLFSRLFKPSMSKKREPSLPRGLAFPVNTLKRPADISHRIFMTHGKEYKVPDITLLTRRAMILNADIVIFGHTHKFWDTTAHRGKIRLINPGCLIGDPNDTVRTYANYEICSFAVLRIGWQGELDVQHLYL